MRHKRGTVVIGGLYEFRFERAGNMQRVPARFLLTFKKIDGHCSSQVIVSHG